MTITELVGRTPILLLLQIKQTAALCSHLRLGLCTTLAKHFQWNQANAAEVSVRVSIAQYAHPGKKRQHPLWHCTTSISIVFRTWMEKLILAQARLFLSLRCSVNAATCKFAYTPSIMRKENAYVKFDSRQQEL